MYVNGVQQGVINQSFDLPLHTIGASNKGYFYGVRALLDDIRIYSTKLSAADIKKLADGVDAAEARLVVAESGGSTAVAENGGTDSFTVALGSRPTHPVTVAITAAPVVGGGDGAARIH